MAIVSMISPMCENCMPKEWNRTEGKIHASINMIIGLKAKIRDNKSCQQCGSHSRKKLVAHHILKAADHPELRYDVNNLITLCRDDENCLHALEFAYIFWNTKEADGQ